MLNSKKELDTKEFLKLTYIVIYASAKAETLFAYGLIRSD